MSVIPQEDNLVMSFAQATRLFNNQQSNTGSYVAGTGDATHQDPVRGQSYHNDNEFGRPPALHNHNSQHRYPSYLGENGRNSHENESRLSDATLTHRAGPGRQNSMLKPGAHDEGLDRPFETVDSPAAVVPSAVPTRQQIAANPDAMVEIRHPRQDSQIDEYYEEEHYSNPWFSIRRRMRVYFAEFLGTMILVLWGEGTQAQVVAARVVPDDYLSIAWGWGVGFMLAIYVSSGISGGHINPAVTIALAVFRKFPWRRVPGYILAQMLGGFAGAAVIFGVYYGPLHAIQGGYAAILTTGPAAVLPSVAATFFSVFSGAALLMGAIAAFTDTGNNPTSPGMTPLMLGLIMVGIASSFGFQTGFVLNPARDLGPRFLVWATGVSGRTLWLDDTAYGIWQPLVGTTTGALFGIFFYDLLIYNGRDSPVNFNFARHRNRHSRGNQRVYNEKNDLHTAENGKASRLSDTTARDQTADGLHKVV